MIEIALALFIGILIGGCIRRAKAELDYRRASHDRPMLEQSLQQRDYDFWFAECCRLYALATRTYQDSQSDHFLRVLHSYGIAARRFHSAAEKLRTI